MKDEIYREHLAGLDLTEAGKAWLATALHPASALPPVPIPDGAQAMSTCPTIVREINVPSLGVDWDCLIITTNSDTTAGIILRRVAGQPWNFSQVSADPAATPGWMAAADGGVANTSVYQVVTNKHSIQRGGGAADESSGAIGGWSYGLGAGPTAILGWTPDVETVDGAQRWRATGASVTAYMTASAVWDGGFVTAGTFDGQADHDTVHAFSGGVAMNGRYPQAPNGSLCTGCTRAKFKIPVEVAEMTAMNPGVYTAPARTGVYIPSRLGRLAYVSPPYWTRFLHGPYTGQTLSSPSPFYAPNVSEYVQRNEYPGLSHRMADQQFVRSTEQPFTDNITYMARNVLSTEHSARFFDDFAAGGPTRGQGEQSQYSVSGMSTGIDDRLTTIILFSGLNAQASVTVKFVTRYELVMQPDSALAEYSRKPPARDEVALQAYRRIVDKMPQGFPASMNAFGGIIPMLWKAASVVAPLVGRGLRALFPVPADAPLSSTPILTAPTGPAVDMGTRAGFGQQREPSEVSFASRSSMRSSRGRRRSAPPLKVRVKTPKPKKRKGKKK
jgi:hypothetical protein